MKIKVVFILLTSALVLNINASGYDAYDSESSSGSSDLIMLTPVGRSYTLVVGQSHTGQKDAGAAYRIRLRQTLRALQMSGDTKTAEVVIKEMEETEKAGYEYDGYHENR